MSETHNAQLLSACEYNNLPQAQQAVIGGANVNCLASTGWSPVMLAILHNHNTVVDWLLAMGTVDVNVGKTFGTTLHVACWVSDDEKIVTKVATLSENVNIVNKSGYTPIQWAVYKGNVKGVKGLLQVSGVNWQIKDEDGNNLLDMAR